MLNIQLLIALSIVAYFPIITAHAAPPVIAKTILDLRDPGTHSQITTHDWTLGATGLRGWCQVSQGYGDGGTTLDSRQILITEVAAKSPASNKLKKNDVIIGINGKKFTKDARVTLGKALSAAEEKGELQLIVHRDDTEKAVTLQLKKLPPFSDTAPFDCAKSKFILTNGCQALAKNGLGRPFIDSHINALTLLATGDPQYSSAIRDHAHKTLKQPLKKEMQLSCWSFSFTNIFLCEYYLITRDSKVLPEIERLSQCIVDGQSVLGTWGHKFKNETTNTLNGYGAINVVGIPCAISLVLAKECGSKVDNLDKAISLSRNFLKSYQGLGAIPYGEHPPNIKDSPDDNGKNSVAAILFNLLDDGSATAYFAKTSLATHGYERERGHAGNLTSIFWSLPAISLAGKEATGAWMKEFGWYFDLARDENLRFKFQGAPKDQINTGYTRFNCPGAYLLHYALPLKKLRITGRDAKNNIQLAKSEIADIIHYRTINYAELPDDRLLNHIKSWSPTIRIKAIEEYKKRPALQAKTPVTFDSKNAFARIAAAKLSNDLAKIATLLNDPIEQVRIDALRILEKKNKREAFKLMITHLSSDAEVEPLFLQVFAELFLPRTIAPQRVAQLLKPIKDHQKLIKVIARMLEHQVTVVAGAGAAMIPHLEPSEKIPLLPLVYEKAKIAPKGDVMFGNLVRINCTKILASIQLQEGMETSAMLLTDQSWGRNARLYKAASLLLQYKGHAKQSLPQLKDTLKTYEKGSEWHKLIKQTISKIEGFPKPENQLKSITST